MSFIDHIIILAYSNSKSHSECWLNESTVRENGSLKYFEVSENKRFLNKNITCFHYF